MKIQLTEGDKGIGPVCGDASFQLTPSRRATINLPPLALRSLISTHALTEGDSIGYFFLRTKRYFNSRPHGGRPEETLKAAAVATISTHALTEGDVFSSVKSMHAFNFNSRPHGGRQDTDECRAILRTFQLTPSRRATREDRQLIPG